MMFDVLVMLRRHLVALAVGSMLLVNGTQSADMEIITENGPVVTNSSAIPRLYEDGVVNNGYFEFLKQVFPNGFENRGIDENRQHFLFRYCIALFEIRSYALTKSCLDAVAESVKKFGDSMPEQTYWLGRPMSYDLQKAGAEYPLAVRGPMLRSELELELGNFRGAAKFAAQAEHQRKKIDFTKLAPRLGQFPDRVLSRTSCEQSRMFGLMTYCGIKENTWIEMVSHLAVVTALTGSSGESDNYVAMLENELNTIDGKIDKVLNARLRAGLARAYMTRKDYRRALDLAIDDSDLVSNLFTLGFGLFAISKGSGLGADIFTATFRKQHSILTRFQIGHALLQLGKLPEAKMHLDDILSHPEIKSLPAIYWAALHDQARIAEVNGATEDAIFLYTKAIEEIERQRSTINIETSKVGFFGDKQATYQALIRLLFDAGRPEDAFIIGERSKSRALVDVLAHKQDFRIAGSNNQEMSHLLAQSQMAEPMRDAVIPLDGGVTTPSSRARGGGLSGNGRDEGVTEIVEKLEELKSKARVELAAQAPSLAALLFVPEVELARIRRGLSPDQKILSYYYDEENLFAFMIGPDSFAAVRLAREGLESDIQAFRTSIIERREDHLQLGRKLYDRLIGPLSAELKIPKILVAGHGKLHYLPFAALYDGTEYLLDRYELSYLPSASTLEFVGHEETGGVPGSLLALGNPDLGDNRYDLPFAEKEAMLVASFFPKSLVLLRKDASKKMLTEYGKGFRYLHFATHGEFDSEQPLLSSLMLAGRSATDVSDRLTVSELYSMELPVDLVTLSACETGLGSVANGDDVVGLVRGFFYAGARRVISTLWPIDDEATSALMAGFYQQFKVSGDPIRALRSSQLAVRAKLAHPFFWAPFEVTGGR